MSVINEESMLIESKLDVVEEPVIVPVVEEPVIVPVVEEPVIAPVVEEPVIAPVVEEPVIAPVTEEPVITPVTEEPVITPVTEEPVIAPVVEEPVIAPVTEEQSVIAPVVEEPVIAPVTEEPVIAPVTEEPVIAPVTEEQSVITPVVEEQSVITPVVEASNVLDPNTNEIVEQIIQSTFHQLFEKTLHDAEFKINPEIKEYLLILCKENPVFFSDVEESLKKIIIDDKINSKDIPEIILLVGKIYEIIKSQKNSSNVDPYEIIKILLQTVFITYFKINNINNPELEDTILHIITVSIQLIKLQAFKPSKKGCLSRFFNF
jgi:hypothetical protein